MMKEIKSAEELRSGKKYFLSDNYVGFVASFVESAKADRPLAGFAYTEIYNRALARRNKDILFNFLMKQGFKIYEAN